MRRKSGSSKGSDGMVTKGAVVCVAFILLVVYVLKPKPGSLARGVSFPPVSTGLARQRDMNLRMGSHDNKGSIPREAPDEDMVEDDLDLRTTEAPGVTHGVKTVQSQVSTPQLQSSFDTAPDVIPKFEATSYCGNKIISGTEYRVLIGLPDQYHLDLVVASSSNVYFPKLSCT